MEFTLHTYTLVFLQKTFKEKRSVKNYDLSAMKTKIFVAKLIIKSKVLSKMFLPRFSWCESIPVSPLLSKDSTKHLEILKIFRI